MTNRWNNYIIRYISQYPDIWFNERFNLNLKFNKIKGKYEKDGDYMKSHVFNFLTEVYKPVRISWNVNISKMAYKDPSNKFVGFGRHNWAETGNQRGKIPKRNFNH